MQDPSRASVNYKTRTAPPRFPVSKQHASRYNCGLHPAVREPAARHASERADRGPKHKHKHGRAPDARRRRHAHAAAARGGRRAEPPFGPSRASCGSHHAAYERPPSRGGPPGGHGDRSPERVCADADLHGRGGAAGWGARRERGASFRRDRPRDRTAPSTTARAGPERVTCGGPLRALCGPFSALCRAMP